MDSNRLLFSNLGIDINKRYVLAYLSYPDSGKALQDGEIAGMSTPTRAPAEHIRATLAAAGGDIQILAFTDEQLAEVDAGLGLWTSYSIPAGTYPGQDSDIQTAAKSNFLAAHASVDEDVVYELTKTIFENLDDLRSATRLTRETSLDEASLAAFCRQYRRHCGAWENRQSARQPSAGLASQTAGL